MPPKKVPTESECLLWFENKNINPITKRKIIDSGPVYLEFSRYYYRIYKLDKKDNKDNIEEIQIIPQKSEENIENLSSFPILSDIIHIKQQINTHLKYKWESQGSDSSKKITYKNKSEHIKGRESQMYCYIDTYESIHENKFIMLKNGNCYDIEVLMNHITSSYDKKTPFSDPGNIDPDNNTDKIWNDLTDLKRLIAHKLIQNSNIIQDTDWLYGKKKFIENCKFFRSKVIKNNIWDLKYLDFFERNLSVLLEINRLGFIFHTDQPTNFFDPEKIVFEDLGNIDNTKLDVIYESLMKILNETYKKNLNHIRQPDKLKHEIVDIFTAECSEIYNIITKDLNCDYDMKIKILINLSYMYGLSQNFKESIKAKEDFMKHITTYPKNEKKILFRLLKHVLKSDECIHLLGNRLKKIFIKYWFLFLESKGIPKKTIAMCYIPKTYGQELNNKAIIKSNILLEDLENTHGYYYTVLNNTPYWVNKMGISGTWDGISLKDYDQVIRKSNKF